MLFLYAHLPITILWFSLSRRPIHLFGTVWVPRVADPYHSIDVMVCIKRVVVGVANQLLGWASKCSWTSDWALCCNGCAIARIWEFAMETWFTVQFVEFGWWWRLQRLSPLLVWTRWGARWCLLLKCIFTVSLWHICLMRMVCMGVIYSPKEILWSCFPIY